MDFRKLLSMVSGVAITRLSVLLLFVPMYGHANTVTIDTATKFQTIDGFGWHGAMALYWNPGPYYNAQWASLVIDTLGLTLERNVFDNLTEFQNEQAQMLLALKAQAAASHEPLQLWVSIWSPPSNLKTGNTTNGGSLIAADAHAYGDWLVTAVQAYQSAGLTLYGLSPQNEPGVNSTGYSTCVYTPATTYVTMFDTVAPILKKNFPNLRILGSENCCLDFQTVGFNSGLLDDTTAKKYLDIFAYHDYQGTASWAMYSYLAVQSMMAGIKQRLWQTESGYQGDSIANSINLAFEIYNNLTVAQVNAYHWWQGCGDADLTNFSVIDANGNIGKRFWALRQYYRFVRPGATRIKATLATADTNLLLTAFKRKTVVGGDNWAIVVTNRQTTSKGIRLAGTGLPPTFDVYQTSVSLNGVKVNSIAQTDSLILPGQSITTLVYGDFHGGVDITSGLFAGVENGGDKSVGKVSSSAPVRLKRKAGALSVEYDVSGSSAVRITVVSMDGRTVVTLIDKSLVTCGKHQILWKPTKAMGKGVYIIEARIADRIFSIPSPVM